LQHRVDAARQPAVALPMPTFTRLAAELTAMRTGRGPRRLELRRLLATVDPAIRSQRNLEHVKLSGIRARLRNLDTRSDSAPLLAAEQASALRLVELDRRLLEAIAAHKK
jgi:hypothetical protein